MIKAEIKNREEEAKARNFRMYQEALEKNSDLPKVETYVRRPLTEVIGMTEAELKKASERYRREQAERPAQIAQSKSLSKRPHRISYTTECPER
jgi:hypothetical protein